MFMLHVTVDGIHRGNTHAKTHQSTKDRLLFYFFFPLVLFRDAVRLWCTREKENTSVRGCYSSVCANKSPFRSHCVVLKCMDTHVCFRPGNLKFKRWKKKSRKLYVLRTAKIQYILSFPMHVGKKHSITDKCAPFTSSTKLYSAVGFIIGILYRFGYTYF